MATLPPYVSRLSRQCGILNISQPYRPPRPVTEAALLCLQFSARWNCRRADVYEAGGVWGFSVRRACHSETVSFYYVYLRCCSGRTTCWYSAREANCGPLLTGGELTRPAGRHAITSRREVSVYLREHGRKCWQLPGLMVTLRGCQHLLRCSALYGVVCM
jgi:hypothetical protein